MSRSRRFTVVVPLVSIFAALSLSAMAQEPPKKPPAKAPTVQQKGPTGPGPQVGHGPPGHGARRRMRSNITLLAATLAVGPIATVTLGGMAVGGLMSVTSGAAAIGGGPTATGISTISLWRARRLRFPSTPIRIRRRRHRLRDMPSRCHHLRHRPLRQARVWSGVQSGAAYSAA